ncbi:lantibiotic dehydratase [Elizabethkingia anophelis]|nr:lantibiotic dehydratase [Elizabethkingia anophelis]
MPVAADFYLLRVPHFSVTQLYALNKKIEQEDIYGIKRLLKNETFLNAIYLSSRYFYDVALLWLENENIRYDPEDKILISLYKYYSRICTRSTPYGLFAGFCTGSVSYKESKIIFSDKSFDPIFRIDMLFLKKIKKQLLQNQTDGIVYYPNNSIYKIGGDIRYIEWDKDYNYEITEIENNIVLDSIFQISRNGMTKFDIVSDIEHKYSYLNKEEILEYLDSLIDSKILVDSLPPFLTSLEDPLLELNHSLKRNGINTDILKPIVEFQKQNISDLSSAEFKEMTDYCSCIIGEDDGQFYQVDLKVKLESNNVNRLIVEHLSKVAIELKSVSVNHSQERLLEFYQKYSNKFETKEIPLSRALDPQIGVGYGLQTSGNVEETPLTDEIYFTYNNNDEKETIPPIIKIIIDRYIDCFNARSSKIINLSENDIREASSGKSEVSLQNDYYLFGDLLANSLEELDNLNFKFFAKTSIPSPFPNNILSRFAYHDEELMKKLKSNMQINDSLIHAEVIHHPNDRVGNILLRPNFYDFEIPYVTQTKGDKIKIDISDILIRVDRGKIILRSKSLNKEIKPHLTSAYNYSQNQLAAIRFLGDLQYHSKFNGFNWDWSIFRNKSYLPRVEYKNIILSEARWKIDESKGRLFSDFKDYINTNEFPRYCNYKEGDNVLLLDLENEICLRTLYSKAKEADIFIYESFVDNLFITKGKEKFTAEFIFPLYTQNVNEHIGVSIIANREAELPKRDFYIGSEWTYFKIYCSHIFGDTVLKNVIAPFLNDYKERVKKIDWFYIRYDDPEPHIRFRIHEPFNQEILNMLNTRLEPLLAEGIVFSFQMDRYSREIERYGKKNIQYSERLFHFDSEAALKFINSLDAEGYNESVRWKIGIVSLDILLDDFEISIRDRIILFENSYKSFLPEFVDISNKDYVKSYKKSIDKQHRKYKELLDSLMRKKDYQELEIFATPYTERSQYVSQVVNTIRNNEESIESLLNLLQSYIHMSLNRIFFTKARMHELIIYYFMFQTYNSMVNRNDEK